MALFEALGELAGTAILTAAPACDLAISPEALANRGKFSGWLQVRGDAVALNGIVDALAREIWVSAETRGHTQQVLEHHAVVIASILATFLPAHAHLSQAIERARSSDPAGASEPIARRISVDIFARARSQGAISSANLKDDVSLFLIDQVYAHLLDTPAVLLGMAPAIGDFIASQASKLAVAPAESAASGLRSLGLSARMTKRLESVGGPVLLADLRERFGLTEKAMRRLLSLVDEQGTRIDDIVPRLEELSGWLGDVRAQLLKPSNDEPEIRRLKSKAAAALADGDFEAAMETLRHVRREIREARRRIEERLQDEVAGLKSQMLEEARATARLAELAMTRREFASAAELFAEASLSLPSTDREGAWRYNLQRADALYAKARDETDGGALSDATNIYGQAVRSAAENANPKGLVQACLGHGNALLLVGERETGSGRLKDAAQAYRKAINGMTRENDARSWSLAHLNLGRALALTGERDNAVDVLREAAGAYREALREIDAERFPVDHAAVQMGLGGALLGLEEREGGTPLLAEAIEAYSGSLEVLEREAGPALWAEAQLNLGLALLGLGEQQGSINHLERAASAFRSALEITTREAVPQKWALTQMNLGNALAAIGELDPQGTGRLADAISAYNAALEEFRRETEPLKWAITQMNFGTALIRMGERKDKRRHWLAAASSLVPALEVFETHGAEAYADATRRNLRRFHESWDNLISAPATPSTDRPRLTKAG